MNRIEIRPFEILVPNLEGDAVAERITVEVPMEWDAELKEFLLTPEAHEMIDGTKARHLGLLSPSEIKALRNRIGISQFEISALLQTGEKSYTRWENGRGRPSRVINLLLRAVEDDVISIEYLRAIQDRADLGKRSRAAMVGWSRALASAVAPAQGAEANGWKWIAEGRPEQLGVREVAPKGFRPRDVLMPISAGWVQPEEISFTDCA